MIVLWMIKLPKKWNKIKLKLINQCEMLAL